MGGLEKVAPLAREYKFIAKKSLRGGWYYGGSLRGFVPIVFKSGAHSAARRRDRRRPRHYWPESLPSALLPTPAPLPCTTQHACTKLLTISLIKKNRLLLTHIMTSGKPKKNLCNVKITAFDINVYMKVQKKKNLKFLLVSTESDRTLTDR